MTKITFNPAVRYTGTITNEVAKEVADNCYLNDNDSIDLELFFTNSNISKEEQKKVAKFIELAYFNSHK
jgi:hypothetical protein